MDATRIDRITRALAGGTSRRGFLAGASGLAAALVGGRSVAAVGDCHYHCVPPSDLCQVAFCQDDNTCVITPVVCDEGMACDLGVCEPCTPSMTVTGTVHSLGQSYVPCGTSESYNFSTDPFLHCGGPLTVRVRGVASDGGTHPDPIVALYKISFISTAPCASLIGSDDDSGCGTDALLSFADLEAGAYTVVVGANSFPDYPSVTYTLEFNQPEPPCSG